MKLPNEIRKDEPVNYLTRQKLNDEFEYYNIYSGSTLPAHPVFENIGAIKDTETGELHGAERPNGGWVRRPKGSSEFEAEFVETTVQAYDPETKEVVEQTVTVPREVADTTAAPVTKKKKRGRPPKNKAA